MSEELEEWRPVVGWEGLYEVSSLGPVRSVDREIEIYQKNRCLVQRRRGNLLKLSISPVGGYQRVTLQRDATTRLKQVHRLVLEAFVGPPGRGEQGAHNDGDSSNNAAGNLRWATPVDNVHDRVAHGTMLMGTVNHAAKLTEHQIRTIRAIKGRSQQSIADEYGIHQTSVSCIRRQKTWPHIE